MSAYVFLGPSLAKAEAESLVDAVILPPCKMGDVFAVTKPETRAIAIIDGYFESTPAVWHKEILHAIACGITVLGGASMGALRAAELHPFGMIGVGQVFRDFAEGVLEEDDEVAVSHFSAEYGYRCRSDAMVNIRYGLKGALQAGVIGESTHETLLLAAKETHYTERSWRTLLVAPEHAGAPAAEVNALRDWVQANPTDLKRRDAIEVLHRLNGLAKDHLARKEEPPAFHFESTIFWEHLCRYFGSLGSASSFTSRVPNERLIQHARLLDPERSTMREKALLLFLVEQEARRLGLEPPEPRAALERFRRERGLSNARQFSRWMADQDVDREECLAMARAEAMIRHIQVYYTNRIDERRPMALKLAGRFSLIRDHVLAKWNELGQGGIETPGDEDVASMEVVLEWYQKEFGAIPTSLQQHLNELGFGSVRQFLEELYAEYLYRQGDHAASAE